MSVRAYCNIEVRVVITRLWLVLPSDLRVWLRLSLTHQHSTVSFQHTCMSFCLSLNYHGVLFPRPKIFQLLSLSISSAIRLQFDICRIESQKCFTFDPLKLFQIEKKLLAFFFLISWNIKPRKIKLFSRW